MLDDLNDIFYDIDYEAADLKNIEPWTALKLHTVKDAAIVFPPKHWDWHEKHISARVTGFLVSIQSRTPELFTGTKLGAVHMQLFPEKFMNWDGLEGRKKAYLPSEMRSGLLRHVFDRHPGSQTRTIFYVTPRKILDGMSNPWHNDGAALNWELDERFVGAKEQV